MWVMVGMEMVSGLPVACVIVRPRKKRIVPAQLKQKARLAGWSLPASAAILLLKISEHFSWHPSVFPRAKRWIVSLREAESAAHRDFGVIGIWKTRSAAADISQRANDPSPTTTRRSQKFC